MVTAIIPVSAGQPLVNKGGGVTDVWYNFFALLYQRTGGPTGDVSAILDQLGTTQGTMIARFANNWEAFGTLVPGSILVMNPGADVSFTNIQELLDDIGAVHGDILYRGAAGWQALSPVNNGYLKSQGPGADPVFTVVPPTGASVATGLTATGTTQGDALQLAAQWNEITTVPANSGVVLDAFGAGYDNVVWNEGINTLKVYPPVGGEIDALGTNNPYSLVTLKSQSFYQLTATQWRSTQLG